MPFDDAIPEDDFTAPPADGVVVPPWLILLVGRLTIENEALRQRS